MKQLVLISSLILAFSVAQAQEKASMKKGLEEFTEGLTDNVKEGWDASKQAIGDLSQDAQKGIEKTRDGIKNQIDAMQSTYYIDDANSLKEYLGVEIKDVKLLESGEATLSLVLKNLTNKPVQFDPNIQKTDVIMIDKDGIARFATDATFNSVHSIVVPAELGIEVTWVFGKASEAPVSLRIFGIVFPFVAPQAPEKKLN